MSDWLDANLDLLDWVEADVCCCWCKTEVICRCQE
jgi:hypothetical protein